MPSVTLLVFNDLSTDQRVYKIANSLALNGYSVSVVGTSINGSPALAGKNYAWHRIYRRFSKGKLAYLEFHIKAFIYLIRQKRSDILVANDLDTLMPVYFCSIFKKSKIIYDSHEHFTEVPELIHRPLTRKIWGMIQDFFAPRMNQIMTVNNPLAQILSEKFKKNVSFVKNVPFLYHEQHELSKDKILIYQGAVNMGRGIELMIQTMTLLPDWKLWIVGGGDMYEYLKTKHSSEQIIFFGKIPFENLKEITAKARIGLSLEEDLGLNYRIATPNKVFDYVQLGLPIIISDLPGLKSLFNEYAIGEILEARTPENLAKLVKKIDACPEKYQEDLHNAAKQWCWENESQKLLKIYSSVMEQ